MRKFIEKCKNWLSNKSTLWKVIGIQLLILLAIIVSIYWASIFEWLGLDSPDAKVEESAQFYRNRGFFIFAIAGFILTTFGMVLTFWGRIQAEKEIEINKEANTYKKEEIAYKKYEDIDNKYKDAVRNLGNSTLAARVESCRTLESIGIKNESMALECIRLSLHFISNPYFGEEEERKLGQVAFASKPTLSQKLEYLFPINEPLREDIQTAADSVTAICEYYHSNQNSLNLGVLDLPIYFWKNQNKSKISLPSSIVVSGKLKEAYLRKANLEEADFEVVNFQEATLWGANLRNVNFIQANLKYADLGYADLKSANLWIANLHSANLLYADLLEANMEDADLSEAQMQTVKNLTKEQILSAKWGRAEIDSKLHINPPELPEEFLSDKDIKIWLEKPHYDMTKAR